jgi:hypothetical protein
MASNINSNNINGAYPIAGQDNDSQGFRDNFTNIKNNLASAKLEIEELQSKSVLKLPLVGTPTTQNNFNGVALTGGVLVSFSESKYQFLSPTPQNIEINFANGDNQSVETNGPMSITFAGWPTTVNVYSKVRVLVKVNANTDTLTFPATLTIGTDKVAAYSTGPITVGHYFFEFSTFDNGNNIIVVPLVTP